MPGDSKTDPEMETEVGHAACVRAESAGPLCLEHTFPLPFFSPSSKALPFSLLKPQAEVFYFRKGSNSASAL